MQPIHKERLLALADFLEKLPVNRFNYTQWIERAFWGGDPLLSCGTKACALGWAATMPMFRELGLQIVKAWDGSPDIALFRDGKDLEYSMREIIDEVFGVVRDPEYEPYIFRHPYNMVRMLFIPTPEERLATPGYVASKIRIFVEEHCGIRER